MASVVSPDGAGCFCARDSRPARSACTRCMRCLTVRVLGVTLWLPQMLKQRGLSTTAIGFTSAFPYLVASIGMIAWSFYVDRSRAYLGNYVIGCVVAAGGFALSVAVDSLPIMIAGISLALKTLALIENEQLQDLGCGAFGDRTLWMFSQWGGSDD